jgi:hypothetical protein
LGGLPNSFGLKFDSKNYNTRTVTSINEYQAQKELTVYPDVISQTTPTMLPRPAWSSVCH